MTFKEIQTFEYETHITKMEEHVKIKFNLDLKFQDSILNFSHEVLTENWVLSI